jgi:hypothetical protein
LRQKGFNAGPFDFAYRLDETIYFFMDSFNAAALSGLGWRRKRRSSSAGNSLAPLWIKALAWGFWVNSRWNAVLPRYQTGQDFLFEICHASALVLRIQLFHGWMHRRVDPDSFKKHEGWWPTPKIQHRCCNPALKALRIAALCSSALSVFR